MVLKGHVSDGVIVIEEPDKLPPDGTPVVVSLPKADENSAPYRKYRGTPYKYDRPFDPAAPPSDWDSVE